LKLLQSACLAGDAAVATTILVAILVPWDDRPGGRVVLEHRSCVDETVAQAHIVTPARTGQRVSSDYHAHADCQYRALAQCWGPMSPSRSRFVVAEDSAVLRMCVVDLLGPSVEVTEADNGAALLALVSRMTFDLVITDIRMPRISGVDVLRARRQQGDFTPYVLMSGSPLRPGEIDDVSGAIFLDKPFTHETLLDAVARALALPPPPPAERPRIRSLR
jgi:CheY-like chemotaxis protein